MNVIRFPYDRRVAMPPNMNPPDLKCRLCDEPAVVTSMQTRIALCDFHYAESIHPSFMQEKP